MSNLFLLVFLLATMLAFSQSKPRESLEPTVTEIWDLKPIKVTPGKNPGEAPSDAIVELEHTLLITEEVLRHLVTRSERPAKSTSGDGLDLDELDDIDVPSGLDDEEDDEDRPEFIDESESEAAPAAID